MPPQITDGTLKVPEREILETMSKQDTWTVDEIAAALNVGYWGVYPYIKGLETKGLITSDGFRRDRKKVFRLADTSLTPKLHTGGPDNPPVALFNLAKGAPVARNNGTETGTWVNNFPYMMLRLYNLAASVQAGHSFDRAVFQSIRTDIVMLRNRLENMIGACNEILNHPVMSGDSRILTDTLLADPNNPLDRETISRLMREAEGK